MSEIDQLVWRLVLCSIFGSALKAPYNLVMFAWMLSWFYWVKPWIFS